MQVKVHSTDDDIDTTQCSLEKKTDGEAQEAHLPVVIEEPYAGERSSTYSRITRVICDPCKITSKKLNFLQSRGLTSCLHCHLESSLIFVHFFPFP